MPLPQNNLAVLYMLAATGLIAIVDTTCKFYTDELHAVMSYCQKLVTGISGGALDQLFSVLEFDTSDDLDELVRAIQASPLLASRLA